MPDSDLKGAMAGLLTSEPALGVDAQRALHAGRQARKSRRIKVGLTTLLVAGVVAIGVPVAVGQLYTTHHIAPGVVATPSPTPTGLAADLVFGDAQVRPDPKHGRVFVIFSIRNDGARPIGVAGIVSGPPASGGAVNFGRESDRTIASASAAARVATVPVEQIPDFLAGLGDATQNVVIASGDSALLVLTFTRDCTDHNDIPAGTLDVFFAQPGVHLLAPPGSKAEISAHRVIDAPSATPSWLTQAWTAACTPTP